MSINYDSLSNSKTILNDTVSKINDEFINLLNSDTISCGSANIGKFKNKYKIVQFSSDLKEFCDKVDNSIAEIKEVEKDVKGE